MSNRKLETLSMPTCELARSYNPVNSFNRCKMRYNEHHALGATPWHSEGQKKKLKGLWKLCTSHETQDFASISIVWKLNAEGASWWGRELREWLACSVKNSITKTVDKTSATSEGQRIVSCKAECVLDSRSLTYADIEQSKLEPLTALLLECK